MQVGIIGGNDILQVSELVLEGIPQIGDSNRLLIMVCDDLGKLLPERLMVRSRFNQDSGQALRRGGDIDSRENHVGVTGVRILRIHGKTSEGLQDSTCFRRIPLGTGQDPVYVRIVAGDAAEVCKLLRRPECPRLHPGESLLYLESQQPESQRIAIDQVDDCIRRAHRQGTDVCGDSVRITDAFHIRKRGQSVSQKVDFLGIIPGRVEVEQVLCRRDTEIKVLQMLQLGLERDGHAYKHDRQDGLDDDADLVEAHFEAPADAAVHHLDRLEGGEHPGGKKSGKGPDQQDRHS